MRDLAQSVFESIHRHGLFAERQRILVAVSGGVDSMVLLHLLHALSRKNKWELTVAHLNHQLRGKHSQADEELVRRTATVLNLSLVVEQADVRSLSRRTKLSLEMAARQARHGFLARAATKLRIPTVALAHHADDQIELFFLRLLRGSGSQGLVGMKWKAPSPVSRRVELVRPLLAISKSALREYAREHNVLFREDATNACLDILRNRIRHELLPLLRVRYQPALAEVVNRTVDILRAEAELVETAASEWLTERGKPSATPVSQECRPFDGLHPALQRRILQAQLIAKGIVADFGLVEKLRTEADVPVSLGGQVTLSARSKARSSVGGEPNAQALEPGLSQISICRDKSGVVHLKEQAPSRRFTTDSLRCELTGTRRSARFGGLAIRWHLNTEPFRRRPKQLPGKELFDADKVGSTIILRHWRRGDRFQPIGMHQTVKLQDFFINQKVPLALRHQLVIATTAKGEVFWIEGQRIAERFKLTNGTVQCLNWAWRRF